MTNSMQATEAVEKLKAIDSDPTLDELKAITRRPTLSDLIRVGSKVTKKATGGWGDGINTACALSAAEIGRQYLQER
jgi:hypothetical protein